MRTLAAAQLGSLEYRVIEAKDAEDALGRLADHHEIDLIVSDVVMPGTMTGFDLKQHLDNSGRALPFVFMSGYSERALEFQGRLSKGAHLLQKPFLLEELARIVRAMLENDA